MVELSNEMLETYGMTRYKSITIKDDPEALRFTRQCLEADQKGARKIKEVTDDGGVVSAYYQLKGVEADINRFVLFKVSKKLAAIPDTKYNTDRKVNVFFSSTFSASSIKRISSSIGINASSGCRSFRLSSSK